MVVIKQAELTSAGHLHQYSREHLEDEHGGLTDQAIDPEEDPLEAIPAEEFLRVWTQRATASSTAVSAGADRVTRMAGARAPARCGLWTTF
ncbi:hypothetical protein ACFY8B_15355 [Streptomyces sp. NPDC012751]|uniref:hypothetical protein n=1 Tax=Streptomyces sp. NPDC012751 TaxID=3364846 RepID=UPI00369ACFA8